MGVYNTTGNIIQTAFTHNGIRLTRVYDIDGNPIPFDSFYPSATIIALPAVQLSGNMQGACTDGTYIYQFEARGPQFIKYKISDGTYTTKSVSGIPFNHGNDMTYNPNNQHIYVASMSSDGSVMELDTEFNYITTHYLEKQDGGRYAVWGLCFDQNTNNFLSEIGNTTMGVYDVDFNYLYSFSMPDIPSATGQGCETDGNYIYRIWYNPNIIEVVTRSGQFVCYVANPMSGEPETMMYDWIHDKYYMNKNSSTDLFYEVHIKKDDI